MRWDRKRARGKQRENEKEPEVGARGVDSLSLARSPEGLAVGSKTAHRHLSVASSRWAH